VTTTGRGARSSTTPPRAGRLRVTLSWTDNDVRTYELPLPHAPCAERCHEAVRGFVLVTVLLLTLATWALLAAMLTTAYLHYRLALGAERGAVAGAAAERAVADYLAAAGEAHAATAPGRRRRAGATRRLLAGAGRGGGGRRLVARPGPRRSSRALSPGGRAPSMRRRERAAGARRLTRRRPAGATIRTMTTLRARLCAALLAAGGRCRPRTCSGCWRCRRRAWSAR
jgi:hypothetical protein